MPQFADDHALDAAVDTLRFLGDRNRLRILRTLARAELCVLDLIDELQLPQPLVSYHLRKLREAGLVSTRRRAQWIFYSLDPRGWATLVEPITVLTDPLSLPPEASFGANGRRELVAASADD